MFVDLSAPASSAICCFSVETDRQMSLGAVIVGGDELRIRVYYDLVGVYRRRSFDSGRPMQLVGSARTSPLGGDIDRIPLETSLIGRCRRRHVMSLCRTVLA